MTYIVYEFHEDGMHRGGKRIKGTVENLAAYIAKIDDKYCCTVTDVCDNFILNTYGNMINQCVDKDLLKRLLPILVPFQLNESIKVPEIEYF